ncbi:MAG: FtsX-like permease family protein [Roseivirga sp.]|nr:FtsX-like permease family protein [Roseivirga sp.]
MNNDNRVRPPRLAEKFFLWYCASPLREEIAGDLEERFLDHYDEFGLRKAQLKYWLNVFKFFRWHRLRKSTGGNLRNITVIFRNCFQVAFRSAMRHKSYAALNLFGLILGLSSFIMIMVYVQYHVSFDKFHVKRESIYRLTSGSFAITPNALAPLAAESFPGEVTWAVRSINAPSKTFKHNGNAFKANLYYVDQGFLKMFSFPLLLGSEGESLKADLSLVISRKEALRLFGKLDVIGELVELDDKTHTITAVMEDVPAGSSLRFDYLAPLYTLNFARKPVWNNMAYQTFLLLADGVAPERSMASLNNSVNATAGFEPGSRYFELQSFGNIHLQKDKELQYESLMVTDGQYIYIFLAVAAFLLIIAVVNYVNLTTARSLERAKEVGIRKVTGAVKWQLIFQFLGESFLFVFVSLLLSLGIVSSLMPYFNRLAGVELSLYQLPLVSTVLSLLVIGLLVTFFAGIYPAMAFSRFQPVQVLKGKFSRSRGSNNLRKGLVVFQFIISAFLFTATMAIDEQFDFMMSKDLGMRKDQLLTIKSSAEVRKNYEGFKASLMSNPQILGVSIVNNNPLNVGASHAYRLNESEEFSPIHYLSVDKDFLEVMEMELLTGTGFDEIMVPFSAERPSFLLNETAVRQLGLNTETAVGTEVDIVGSKAPIQGVVKDFHFAPLSQKIGPLVILHDPKKFYRVVVKVNGTQIGETLDFMEEKMKTISPNAVFDYRFQDQAFAGLYAQTSRLKTIFKLFSNMAVVIACLGLLGLVAFTVQHRAKEMGVRKVLGASVMNILTLLSTDFFKLITIALLVAMPLGYYAARQWLSAYAYRAELGVGIFLNVAISATVVTLLIISYQTLSTARVNPARILRDE